MNIWNCWISATVEGDENVKRDKTIDFVALLNTWNCWIRYNVKRLEYWICYTVEYMGQMNEIWMRNYIIQLNLWHCWICGSVEWDMNVKLENKT